MTAQGLVAFGAWLIFMGVAPLAVLLLTRGTTEARGPQLGQRVQGVLRRMRLLGPESFYRAITVPLCVLFVLAGIAMILLGTFA